MRLDHARHNENVCTCLNERNYWDWVVTTAFYAALHYVRYQMFPLGGHPNFDAYYNVTYSSRRHRPGKHKVTSQLVQQHLPRAIGAYNALKNAAWTARYDNYQTTEGEAKAAITRLQMVKGCCPDVPTSQTGTNP